MARFLSGPNVNPFYRATQGSIDLLESADPSVLALAVPFVKITQVDPYTGAAVGKPAFHLDLVSTPSFGRPSNEGRLLERPLVSLEQIVVKAEALVGLAKYDRVEMSFVIHDPRAVFFGDDDISTFRAIMQEGNSFLIEYGWRANCTNDLLNGIGFFDPDAGFTVPSIRRMRVVIPTWNIEMSGDGEMRLSVSGVADGELALREAKLSKHLDLAGLEPERVSKRKRPRASLPQQDRDAGEARSVVAALAGLPKTVISPHGELYKFSDILDALVAPAIEKACASIGYKGVDLYLGNFSSRCPNSAPAYGGKALANLSIGDAMIPVKTLKTELGRLHSVGETIVLSNFIQTLGNMLNDQAGWSDDRSGRPRPEVFIGTATRQNGDGLNFVLFFADRQLSVVRDDEFDRGDQLDPSEQTRAQILTRIKSRGIPIIELGKSNTIVKDCNFATVVDDQMRGVFVDNAMKRRKSQAEVVTIPDPLGRQGRSSPEDYAFLSAVQADVTLLGNFIFSWGQTTWLEIMGIHPITGLYDVRGIEDTITPQGFFTKLRLMTRGTDPLNTRKRKSRSQLEQERLDIENANARRRR